MVDSRVLLRKPMVVAQFALEMRSQTPEIACGKLMYARRLEGGCPAALMRHTEATNRPWKGTFPSPHVIHPFLPFQKILRQTPTFKNP